MEEFNFKCATCGEMHSGIPTFGFDYPIQYLYIPEKEREPRVELGSDDCVIDNEFFFIRGCLEIPVHNYEDPFIWGTWVSVSQNNFDLFLEYFEVEKRSHIDPFFGWLAGNFSPYETSCENLKTMVHLRDNGVRPYIELEPTDHPLAIEQKNGITPLRLQQIYESVMHGSS